MMLLWGILDLLMVDHRRGGGVGVYLLLIAAMAFAFAFGWYAAGSTTTVLVRWEHFLASSWWNLYLSIVMSYITIRWYQLFVDPALERLAAVLYGGDVGGGGGGSLVTASSPRGSGGGGGGLSTTTTPSVDGVVVVTAGRSSLTAKDIAVFRNLKRVDERGEQIENLDDDDDEDENDAMDGGGDRPAGNEKGREHLRHQERRRRRRKQKQHQHQPIDMSGAYGLVSNDNFDNFLFAQGLPWMLARAADRARPIHRITHIGRYITIQIEGLIESSTTYTINGPPVECLIRGRLYADQVTYLTVQDLGGEGGDRTAGSTVVPGRDGATPPAALSPPQFAAENPTTTIRRSRSLDSPADGTKSTTTATTTRATAITTAAAAADAENIANSHTYGGISFDEMMSDGLKSTLDDLEQWATTTGLKKSFDDMIVKPLNETIDGIATAVVAIPAPIVVVDHPRDDNGQEGDDGPAAEGAQQQATSRPRTEGHKRTGSEPKVSSRPMSAIQEGRGFSSSTPVGVDSDEEDCDEDDHDHIDEENEDGAAALHAPPPPVGGPRPPHTAAGEICGIKTTKRAINDGNTVTVSRHLLKDASRIVMTSRVEFDDPHKEPVQARQIFERLKE